MLIPRGTLCTLIAGACAGESIERSPPTAESNETKNPWPILVSARSPVTQQDGHSNETSEDGGSLGYAESVLPAPKENGIEARQVAAVRAPTVFSTSYVTSTITSFAGEPVTSTFFETITATASIVPQKRMIPWNPSSNEVRSHLDDVLVQTPDDPPRGSNRKKRQNNLSTVTSVIYMISRTVVTVAPTVSTTILVTVTIATASDGSTTTLQPSTTSQLPSTTTPVSKTTSSKISSQSSQTSLPTGTPTTSSTLNQGAIAGGVLGSVFGAALLIAIFLCCIRRRRRERKPTKDAHPRGTGYTTTITSTSTLDQDQGTIIHHESFHVGASPPASLAPSASEQKSQQQAMATTPPPLQMKQVLPAVDETSCEVQRPEMAHRQSSRAGMIWLVNDENEEEEEEDKKKEASSSSSNSDGSGFDSNEAQPPSPVASSDIFGAYNSTYRQTRDTWASTTDMSLSFATPRNLTMLGSDFDDRPQTSESMEHAMWRGEDEEQSERDSWSPSIPEKSKRRSQSKETLGKAVRFLEIPTTPTRKSSGSGGKSVDGSSAFL